MNEAFEAAVNQIDALAKLIGVPDNIRVVITMLIAEHGSPNRLQQELVAKPSMNLAQIARKFHKSSLSRNHMIVAGLVQDGPWNMMLDLFAAGEEGRPISVSSLCLASGVPPTTALRAINWLNEQGLIERSPDRDDRRRTWLRLSPIAREKMAAMIAAFTVPASPTIILKAGP